MPLVKPTLKPALWLYFLLFFSSIFGAMLTKHGPAAIATVELIDSMLVIGWAGICFNSIRAALVRKSELRWYAVAGGAAVGTFAVAHILMTSLSRAFGLPMVEVTRFFPGGGLQAGLTVLFFCIQPALIEELAFRGVIFSALCSALRPRDAAIVSAVLFAILHLSIVSFPHLFVMGVILAWLRIRAGTLYPGMLLHLVHNVICVAWEWRENVLAG